jgi:hypothetical protein
MTSGSSGISTGAFELVLEPTGITASARSRHPVSC